MDGDAPPLSKAAARSRPLSPSATSLMTLQTPGLTRRPGQRLWLHSSQAVLDDEHAQHSRRMPCSRAIRRSELSCMSRIVMNATLQSFTFNAMSPPAVCLAQLRGCAFLVLFFVDNVIRHGRRYRQGPCPSSFSSLPVTLVGLSMQHAALRVCAFVGLSKDS